MSRVSACVGALLLASITVLAQDAGEKAKKPQPEEVIVTVGKAQGAAGQEVEIPVSANAGSKLSNMELILTYDPAVLQVKTVDRGPKLPKDCLMQFNPDKAGELRAALACKTPVEGEGVVLKVRFLVKGEAGQKSPLKLQKVAAWESPDARLKVRSEDGEVIVTASAKPKP